MKIKLWSYLLILSMLFIVLPTTAQTSVSSSENEFCMWTTVPDHPHGSVGRDSAVSVSGSGGIRVRSECVRRSLFSRHYNVCIDGSGITGAGFAALNKAEDFKAAVNCAYFVSHSAICTLSTAIDSAGKEIIVCNTCVDGTVTYNTTSGETISGNLSGSLTNSTRYKVDRFISDGINWYKE